MKNDIAFTSHLKKNQHVSTLLLANPLAVVSKNGSWASINHYIIVYLKFYNLFFSLLPHMKYIDKIDLHLKAIKNEKGEIYLNTLFKFKETNTKAIF